MIILTVKKQDGSIYFSQGFNSADEANSWIAEENQKLNFVQSGPMTYEYLDNSPTMQQISAAQVVKDQQNSYRSSALSKIASSAGLTDAERIAFFGE